MDTLSSPGNLCVGNSSSSQHHVCWSLNHEVAFFNIALYLTIFDHFCSSPAKWRTNGSCFGFSLTSLSYELNSSCLICLMWFPMRAFFTHLLNGCLFPPLERLYIILQPPCIHQKGTPDGVFQKKTSSVDSMRINTNNHVKSVINQTSQVILHVNNQSIQINTPYVIICKREAMYGILSQGLSLENPAGTCSRTWRSYECMDAYSCLFSMEGIRI